MVQKRAAIRRREARRVKSVGVGPLGGMRDDGAIDTGVAGGDGDSVACGSEDAGGP